jgi:isoprenylcysteine carboxyl methyltransferase (ICMT) family protein YpbQ
MQAKNRHLPQEFWDLRRRVRNSKRSSQQHAKQKQKRQATKRCILHIFWFVAVMGSAHMHGV